MIEFIRWLIFINSENFHSVASCKEIKNITTKKIGIKKIAMIEKYCGDKNILW